MNQTPAPFYQLMHMMQTDSTLSLRYIILAGEMLLPVQLKPWFAKHRQNSTKIINMYGTTETTVHTTFKEITLQDIDVGTVSPIGTPLKNLETYILDPHKNLAPIGVPGEIYVGGPGLMRCYLNDPTLSKEKLLNISILGYTKRLYKTGDFAKVLESGELEYIGRNDDQIKMRGYRIELGEITHHLSKHPAVKEASVMIRPSKNGEKHIFAYIISAHHHAQNMETDDWRTIWQSVYENNFTDKYNQQPGLAADLIGWNSSYTGRRFAESEMQEWLEITIDRILSLSPQNQRVLEIGCGTGMILFSIAKHCKQYDAVDFSHRCLHYVKNKLANHNLDNVHLIYRSAKDFVDSDHGKYNLIIINSVAQYFPSLDYFISVLEGALRSLNTAGKIFIGDVRNLNSLELFHASVQLHKASNTTTYMDWLAKTQYTIEHEKELLINPNFFYHLQSLYPQIHHVDICIKDGAFPTEMNLFRYDVILHTDPTPTKVQPQTSIHYKDETFLTQLSNATDIIHIHSVPHPHLHALKEQIKQIHDQKSLNIATHAPTLSLHAIKDIANKMGYQCHLTYDAANPLNHITAVLYKPNITQYIQLPKKAIEIKPFANHPIQTKNICDLTTQLKDYLKQVLPPYMIPSAFFFLKKFPHTPNGKLDKKVLATTCSIEAFATYAPPQTKLEKQLAQIWQNILQIEHVGIYDSFFDLGGHSLLAMQLLLEIQKHLNIKLLLKDIFQEPTISGLATTISQLPPKSLPLLASPPDKTPCLEPLTLTTIMPTINIPHTLPQTT